MARLRRNVQSGAGGLRAAAVGRLDLAEYSRLDRRNHRGKHRDSLALGEVGRSANRSPRDRMTASRSAGAPDFHTAAYFRPDSCMGRKYAAVWKSGAPADRDAVILSR